jgi:hypothetical protein
MPTKAKLQEDNAALRRRLQELTEALESQSLTEGAEASQDEPGTPTCLTAENIEEVLESVDRRTEKLSSMVLEYQEKLQRSFECPITYELFKDPVFCVGDGHTYEREAILRHFENSSSSPLTGERLNQAEKVVIPNIFVRQKADELRGGEPDIERSNIVRQPGAMFQRVSNEGDDYDSDLRDDWTDGEGQELIDFDDEPADALYRTRERQRIQRLATVAARQQAIEAEILRIQRRRGFEESESTRRQNEQDIQSLRALRNQQPSGGIGTSGTF